MNGKQCNFWRCGNRVGLFFLGLFVLCVIWYFVNPAERDLHLSLYRLSFFGFNEMNFFGFILGAIQTYVCGYIVVGVWLLSGCCLKKKESCE